MNALRVELRPSPAFAAVLVAFHAAAGAGILVSVGGGTGLLLGAAFVSLGLAAAWSRALLGAPGSPRALEIEGERVTLETRSGRMLAAPAAGRRHASALLVTVPMLAPARRTLLVVRGMAQADAFRALRIWALWGRLPRSTARSVAGKQLPA